MGSWRIDRAGVVALAVACGPSVMTSDGTGSTGTTSEATTAATTSTSTTSATTVPIEDGSSTTGPAGCVPSIEVGPFSLVTATAMGRLTIRDMDLDGSLDLVGGRGVIVLFTASGYAEIGISDPPSEDGRPGQFDGDGMPDVVFATRNDEGIVLLRGPTFADPAVVTAGARGSYFDAHDLDGDGLDEIVRRLEGSNAVEIVRGNADGAFTPIQTMDIANGGQVALAAFDGPVDLVVGDCSGYLRWFRGDGRGGFGAAMELDAALFGIERVAAKSGEKVVGTYADGVLLSPYAGGVMLGIDDGRAHQVGISRQPASDIVTDAAAGDLDRDGTIDLVVAFPASEQIEIDLACGTDWSDDIEICGHVVIPHRPESLAILDDGASPRLVYSTARNGTWIAEVTSTPCA